MSKPDLKVAAAMASILALASESGFRIPFREHIPKVKRKTLDELITEEEQSILDSLELDRSSPGRKTLKDYRKHLSDKYRGES